MEYTNSYLYSSSSPPLKCRGTEILGRQPGVCWVMAGKYIPSLPPLFLNSSLLSRQSPTFHGYNTQSREVVTTR